MRGSGDNASASSVLSRGWDLDYRIERDDMRQFLHWSALNLPAARRMIAIERVVVAALVTLPVLARIRHSDVLVWAAILLVPGLLLAWYGPLWLVSQRADNALTASISELGSWRLRVDDSGVAYSHAGDVGFSGFRDWVDMTRIVEEPSALYLLDEKASALVVPSTAFANVGDARAFADACRAALTAAHLTSVSSGRRKVD